MQQSYLSARHLLCQGPARLFRDRGDLHFGQ